MNTATCMLRVNLTVFLQRGVHRMASTSTPGFAASLTATTRHPGQKLRVASLLEGPLKDDAADILVAINDMTLSNRHVADAITHYLRNVKEVDEAVSEAAVGSYRRRLGLRTT